MSPTILFADNERGIRLFCRQELEAEGFRVVLAEDGLDAVDAMETVFVDIAVLDEHMPRCSGRESAMRIRSTHANVPIILFTADCFLEGHRSTLIDTTVVKSADLTALKRAIATLLPKSISSTMNAARGTKGLGINAAFLNEIKQDNNQITELRESIQGLLEGNFALHRQREFLIRKLRELRDSLAMQFSLEETYGYFEGALSVEPSLSQDAAVVRAEHATMYAEICALVEDAQAPSLWRINMFHRVASRAKSFCDEWDAHERREQKLIERAFNKLSHQDS